MRENFNDCNGINDHGITRNGTCPSIHSDATLNPTSTAYNNGIRGNEDQLPHNQAVHQTGHSPSATQAAGW